MGLGLLLSIIIGGLAGWIASMIMKADTGLITNIVLGIVGALVLNVLLQLIGIYAAERIVPQLVVGILGACLLIFGFRAIARRS
ncbi:GlsB/YeaQ/YmgE family stress response membrane protein [Oceanicola sp. 502str15]|uniref:GlsB/YeaQ/YmgE family stress response membrane protein n=1 Tax=Oceanicola sp. 502str15 TaxID=2696061 RepID=UPI0020943E54|nr:GlsB/YeaQ/YmgE family stress response membrane protein [Oceanicola sp. 502str15]MCO6384594.1 GlsB/YeaQ/YmgE family stress response membrane protein [Oceanicola sp. 502str15]